MPMCADLPKIFAAAGLDIFDMHGPRYASARALLAIERKTRDVLPDGSQPQVPPLRSADLATRML
jgi:hypothetical protein